MSRFSLGGLVQLPIPDDTYTWKQYKAKYGIDLDEVFKVILNGSIYDVTERYEKPILLFDPAYKTTLFASAFDNPGSANKADAYIGFGYVRSDFVDGSYSGLRGVKINGDRTIGYIDI